MFQNELVVPKLNLQAMIIIIIVVITIVVSYIDDFHSQYSTLVRPLAKSNTNQNGNTLILGMGLKSRWSSTFCLIYSMHCGMNKNFNQK